MQFNVKTVCKHYRPPETKHLRELGFTFTPCNSADWLKIGGEGTIIISSAEEVFDFIGIYGEIIWNEDGIIIYDGRNE